MPEARTTAPALAPTGDKPYRPGWVRFAPFLGRPPDLTQRQWRVLGLVAGATLFNQYDRALFALALPQIQRSLEIPEVNVGYLASIVRLGALPAFLVAVTADRLGRRRILLFTILSYTAITGATALAPDARTFVALQFLAAIFTSAEVLLAIVVIAEEFDPETRGWGVGALFAIQACGVGLAAVLLPLVEVAGIGWRALYLVGLGPLVILAYWRRALPETERFERERRMRAEAREAEYSLAPIAKLVRAYPGRFAAIASVVFLFALGGSAADFLGPKYLQDQHGWTPSQVAILYIFGGMLGILGATLTGKLSDRVGRKSVTAVSCVCVSLLAILFYNAHGILLPPLWIVLIFTVMGNDVMLSAYGAEMFPTSYRSTAAGARLIVATVGGVIGLGLESVLYRELESHWMAISVLLGISLLAPVIVALAFPETAGRSLEEIAPER